VLMPVLCRPGKASPPPGIKAGTAPDSGCLAPAQRQSSTATN
ncbi:hypothetical protein AZZ74_001034, partial [Klebsiella pneumoniae]